MIIRIQPKSFALNTDRVSNRQCLGGGCELSISRLRDFRARSTRYTSRPEFSVTHCKQKAVHFLPETPPVLFANTNHPLSRRSSSPGSLATRHLFTLTPPAAAGAEGPLATAFLIVNMIIRIDPNPFVFITNSVSNRQYPGLSAELSISRAAP
jgi:hypothetical protein